MTQPSRPMSQWKNPDSSLGITGFKDRLNTLIDKNSIRSFASECGISDATIRKYLSGQSLPGIDKIEAIVKYTGCSLEWLVTGKGTQQPAPPNNVTPKEIEASWDYIFKSLTLEEKHRVISTFNRGGLQALFAEDILDTPRMISNLYQDV
uniref:Helix-turn-helix domain-containing protein n=1 Tax=Providencia stuartii TaxID=588 RepID=A0AAI9DFZ8_PROST|nr:helix-turn-helix domain-containing protein [Providencia stuartii]